MKIECPGCGRPAELAAIKIDADGFCPDCDYPLFWARPDRPELVSSNGEAVTRRRLPGTVGTITIGHRLCPNPLCHDPNPLTASYCTRCGTNLDPVEEPPPSTPPPPPPPPAPVVVVEPPTDWTPWIVAGLCATAALVLILLGLL
jgi:hypothetical protein